ncbi:MAG TPA: type VI secretion system lipoprotein TssJ [Polyangiales bacterium]|nr:type VI secretion system lipoprotein TssJ [Polyangiales bacterium]
MALFAGVSSACVSNIAPTCKVPTATELEIETSDRVNTDQGGEALPTIIRLYQLTNVSSLQSASFDDMLDRPKETLGKSIVEEDEVTIYPGQIVVRRFERDPKADFIVGVAIVRNPVGSAWRTMQEFPIPGDPCQEQDDPEAAPPLNDLRVRMFMDEYRIESTNNWGGYPLRSCPKGTVCKPGAAPDELPEELRHRRLRTFEEDESRPTPSSSGRGTSGE